MLDVGMDGWWVGDVAGKKEDRWGKLWMKGWGLEKGEEKDMNGGWNLGLGAWGSGV